ncbi:anaerobic ribonucleoside-triphosphate reductase activating protein [Treponema pectinovorum]|uniref:anaerobic ribonucleoside-triphosphate reductase activating protein n=1 Tax=Treponema pectinovorum TaxID=164 RepID=UPI0011C95CB7|nr:anaerobic ribonucleoside-triphosphate reductase activating protein [Treponema pectinovorum]
MYYGEIKKIDIANGLGVRVSLFVSGCRNKCPGCFNQMTWDFKYGKEFTKQTEDEIIEALKPDHIAGLTVLGGEPFEEENQRVLTPFLERVRQIYPQKNIWCYSGYVYDKDLLPKDGKKHCEVTDRMLACIDVLIDGPFIIELKDITLNYRGSSNQRILWLKEDKPINSI